MRYPEPRTRSPAPPRCRAATLPRCHGRHRYNSLTYPQFGNGATRDQGFLVLAQIGEDRQDCRALESSQRRMPKTVTSSRDADGWYVRFSCADVPTKPVPATGHDHETGIDLGLEAFATLSNGERIFHPCW